jgi:transcriptional regulator with XRE-family HTH domain
MESKKERLVMYLLSVQRKLEDETRRPWDQQEIASFLGIPFATLSRLFADNTSLPNQATADRIAIATGSNEIHNIVGTEPTDEADPEYAAFLRIYRTLPIEKRQEIQDEMAAWVDRLRKQGFNIPVAV